MGKLIDLGSAGPNDPIYQGGSVVHFRPSVPSQGKQKSRKKLKGGLPASAEYGRFCVVYAYDNWEGGGCLRDEVKQPVIFEALETAEEFLEIKWREIMESLEAELTAIAKLDTNPLLLSGYTVYGLIAENSDALNQKSWKQFFGVEDTNEEDTGSNIRKFVGFDCEPGEEGVSWSSKDYTDIQDQLAEYFYLS